jgi:hypothetical protein
LQSHVTLIVALGVPCPISSHVRSVKTLFTVTSIAGDSSEPTSSVAATAAGWEQVERNLLPLEVNLASVWDVVSDYEGVGHCRLLRES